MCRAYLLLFALALAEVVSKAPSPASTGAAAAAAAAAAPSPAPASKECTRGAKGPACKTNSECEGRAGCLRCAKSGFCTSEPMPPLKLPESVENPQDCNLCKCAEEGHQCWSGRDSDGLQVPSPEGAETCVLTPWNPLGGSRVSTERTGQKGSDKTSGGSTRYDKAKRKISDIQKQHSRANGLAAGAEPAMQFVPPRTPGVLHTSAQMTCARYQSIFQRGINTNGAISHGQVMLAGKDLSVFVSRVWSSVKKNPRGQCCVRG